MTDLEMTKLCAKAMGYTLAKQQPPPSEADDVVLTKEVGYFQPLREDDAAMALVKKFNLNCTSLGGWIVDHMPSSTVVRNTALNRAIVECVARMWKEKK